MTEATTLTYRPDLQGLRAVSIILVVLAHAGVTLIPGGFIGVDVFFVLSGYLITGLLIHEYAAHGSIDLTRFVARRLKRLFPALFIMLCTVIISSYALLSNYELTQQTMSVIFAATWASNLFFSLSTVDYFAELQTKDLFLHTWSLGVEEQFYLVWPVMILFSLALLKQLRVGKSLNIQLLIIFGVLLLASFGLSLYWTAKNPLWSFYMMPARIWQFALGALTFVWFHPIRRTHEWVWNIALPPSLAPSMGILGLGLILGSAVFINPNVTYPGFLALAPSFGALLVISAGRFEKPHPKNRTLAHPVLVWIGDRSYSWYLWHWPVFMLGASLGIPHTLGETTGLVALSLLLAIISYRYVELPFWKGALCPTNFPRFILLTVLAMLSFIWVVQNYLTPSADKAVQRISISQKARSDVPIIYPYGCDAWYSNADVRPCIFGAAHATKTMVLMGDSIGAQWFSLFPAIFQPPEWRIIVLTKSSCPMVDEDFFYARIGRVYTVCSQWRNAALDYIDTIRPDVVFIGNTAFNDFSKAQWTQGSARILKRLTVSARHVLVIPGTPTLSFDGPGCLDRNFSATQKLKASDMNACRESLVNTQPGTVAHHLEKAVQRFKNAKLLNLNDLVCPSGQCSAQSSDGRVVFRDHQHLTDSFVRAQAPIVRERLKFLGLMPLFNE